MPFDEIGSGLLFVTKFDLSTTKDLKPLNIAAHDSVATQTVAARETACKGIVRRKGMRLPRARAGLH